MRATRFRPAVAAAAAAVMAISACSGGGGDEDGGQTTVTVDGGQPENPLIPANTNEVFGGDVLDTLFSKLVRYDPETAEPENYVAESIETEDNQTFTITVQEGWTFHDGTDVTAQSFVDAWNWGAYGPNANLNAYWFEQIEGYEEVHPEPEDPEADPPEPEAETMSGLKVIDDRTFEVTLSQPYAQFPMKLGYTAFAPLPEVFFEDPEAFGREPVGNGPFRFASWTDNQEITVEAYEDFAGAHPAQVDAVTWRMYDDREAAYADLLAGNLDIMTRLTPAAMANEIYKDDLGDRYVEQEAGLMFTLTVTGNEEGYDDARFRQALSAAIDREAIVEEIFEGTQVPSKGWAPSVVIGAQKGACGEYCEHSPERADELLQAALDDGFEPPDKVQIWFNDDADHREWVQAVVNSINQTFDGDLEAVAKPVPTFSEFRAGINEDKYTGLLRTGWQMDYPHLENFLSPLYETGASSNDGDYSNEEFDQLMADARQESDEDAAIEMYREGEQLLAEDMPALPIYTARTITGYSEEMTNVEVTPFGVPAFANLEK
ncbi:ABC transporter substrate-binding protein [Streptomonospora algeriensis]|uniref:ABC transporter substrate-binding protein n=1 Tax=Streptomonospora algeriensis TaxID=995084 RepID=A0ABW3BCV1_9ACTN